MGIPFIWGTLLAPSTILYGCGTADGNRHPHEMLPTLVMCRTGARRESFGDSAGVLEI
jgi:hypothetical protein